MRAMAVTMLLWAVATFAMIGYYGSIDGAGFCGQGHPVQVALFGYQAGADPLDASVEPACRAQARHITFEAVVPTVGLLVVARWLWRAENRYRLIEPPPG